MRKAILAVWVAGILLSLQCMPGTSTVEAAQVIGEVFGQARPTAEDVIMLHDGSAYVGDLLDEVVGINTQYADMQIPIRKCAGISFSPAGYDSIVTVNHNRLTGIVYTREFSFRERTTGGIKRFGKQSIKHIILRQGQEEAAFLVSIRDTGVLVMTNGDILSGRLSPEEIMIRTVEGSVGLDISDVSVMRVASSDSRVVEVTKADGTALTGVLETERIDMAMDIGILVEGMHASRLSELTTGKSCDDVSALYSGKGEASAGKQAAAVLSQEAGVAANEEDGPSLAVRIPGSSVELKMRLIPAGTFTMGSPSGEADRSSDEGPQHQVTITKPFYMGIYEVTQAQWEAVIGTRKSWFGYSADLPVEKVSWEDCQKFITKLNTMGQGTYRLPTEAEWEYACRAGSTTRFPWGDDPGYSELGQYGWYSNNSSSKTHPVGQKEPNAWGLYDMHGNVCEWCSDWYGGYSSGAQTDPQGPATGSLRVLRGGSWGFNPQYCRSASRLDNRVKITINYVGFRLVRTSP